MHLSFTKAQGLEKVYNYESYLSNSSVTVYDPEMMQELDSLSSIYCVGHFKHIPIVHELLWAPGFTVVHHTLGE